MCLSICVCVRTTSSLSLYPLRHSGCFYILAILNNVSMNSGELVLFLLEFFHFWISTQKEQLGQMVVLILIFWEISILFSIMATLIYSPINIWLRFPFLHILSNIFHSIYWKGCPFSIVCSLHLCPRLIVQSIHMCVG